MKNSDYVKTNSVKPVNCIMGEAGRSFEKKNVNKYLIFTSTDKNKKLLEKYIKLWNEIKLQIKVINGVESLNQVNMKKIHENQIQFR